MITAHPSSVRHTDFVRVRPAGKSMRMFNWIRIVGVVMVLALVGACAKRQRLSRPGYFDERAGEACDAAFKAARIERLDVRCE